MAIVRVFPRRTKATPDDEYAFVGSPPERLEQHSFFHKLPEVEAIHISVAFTYDIPKAESLARQWERIAPVKMGGPACNEPGGAFVPGLYLKKGYVITSRGCPNRCWFCGVPAREGYALRELPVTEGWNVLDDNLLACSDRHIRAMFEMLSRQPERPVFTGGLEAGLLKPWHVDLLRESGAKRMYFAYDTPEDYEPLVRAGKMLREGGISEASHKASCYVLIGYRGDTFAKAEKRLTDTVLTGFLPFAMLYRDTDGNVDKEWRAFQSSWLKPRIVGAKIRKILSSQPKGGKFYGDHLSESPAAFR